MQQDHMPVSTHRFDPEDDFGPEAGIVSFPASVQRKIDRAADALRDGDPREALSTMHQVGTELSRTDPLLFAALMAAQMGVAGISVSRLAKTVRTVRSERRACGVRYGEDVETTTEESFEERAVSFGPPHGGRR